MRDVMTHRGPDDEGLYVNGPIGLGHRRLSILDLSPAGHQPMSNEDGTVWLIFNGEIYNYVELASELRGRGHTFRSHTDSEVIIHLWEELGSRCVERLNGMFAFVIWDATQQELFCARDRVGIKPFQYYLGPDRFIAASEIKAILEDPAVPRRPDHQGLSDYLFAGRPLSGKTCFEGIRQLEPGCALSICHGKFRTWEYWNVDYAYNTSRSLDDTAAGLRDLLADAVRIQGRSDAPLGCHLSGGLDSSTIVALTAPHRERLDTFSIRFEGETYYDESAYARAMARRVGSRHHEGTPAASDLRSLVTALVWHMDMPLPDTSSFSYYTVSRLASSHVKVSLTGHGGDEVFGGYPAQFQAGFGHTAMFDLSGRPAYRTSLARRLHRTLRRYGVFGTARHLLGRLAPKPPADLETLWVGLHCGTPPARNPLLHSGFRARLGGYDPRADYLAPLREAGTDEVFDRCLFHDFRSYLPTLLHQEDRASMAVSLESRVPLLDHRVVEFMATVHPSMKVPGLVPKGLLRRSMADLVPAEILARRDKGAFGVPTGPWFLGPLAPFVRELVLSKRALEREIFHPAEIASRFIEPSLQWSAMSLELWFRIFIDRDSECLERIGDARAGAAETLFAESAPAVA